jgi:hypothetical protein
MSNQIKIYLLASVLFIFISCKENTSDKPFEFNGQSFYKLVINSINEDENSKKILNGLFTFETDLASYNKIEIDSLEINNVNYYSLLLENQNPIYNLFAIVDKDMNLILKDESLNGYLDLNFKKSGSRRFAVIKEEFNSKDVIELNRISYYSLEQYSSELAFRQFTKIKTTSKEIEQVISGISDTAIVTSIVSIDPKTSKTSKDVFIFDFAKNKYISDKNLFEAVVKKEIESLNIKTKNPQITDAESIMRFFDEDNANLSFGKLTISENDFEIALDSTWKKLGNVTISNHVKQKLNGIKYINGKLGAGISLAAIAPTESAENYFNAELKNSAKHASSMRFSDKLIDTKNIYQLFEFNCPAKKILMILETPKSIYEINKIQYELIINTFLIKC